MRKIDSEDLTFFVLNLKQESKAIFCSLTGWNIVNDSQPIYARYGICIITQL